MSQKRNRSCLGKGKVSIDFTEEREANLKGPLLPSRMFRSMIGSGPMDSMTTVRHDYSRKHVEKPEIILPCGNIRLSTGKLEGYTTAKLSYGDPGPTEPTINFKPARIYCPPSEPILHDTTQKLSYQPVCIEEKEIYPWKQKPTYKYAYVPRIKIRLNRDVLTKNYKALQILRCAQKRRTPRAT